MKALIDITNTVSPNSRTFLNIKSIDFSRPSQAQFPQIQGPDTA